MFLFSENWSDNFRDTFTQTISIMYEISLSIHNQSLFTFNWKKQRINCFTIRRNTLHRMKFSTNISEPIDNGCKCLLFFVYCAGNSSVEYTFEGYQFDTSTAIVCRHCIYHSSYFADCWLWISIVDVQKILIPLLIHSKYFKMFNQFALLYASLGNSFLNVPNECMHELLASKPINSVYWPQNL